MRPLPSAALGLAAVASVALGACQSTQTTSEIREKNGAKFLDSEEGLKITQVNQDLKVLETKVLSDVNGAAVVVTVKNQASQGLVNVPLSIDVRDKKGKSIYKNDIPGLLPSLTSIPLIGPNETVDWVNDQVLTTGKPDSVKVELGQTEDRYPSALPEIELTEPKLEEDSVSGLSATGEIQNRSPIEQKDITLYAVARKGGEIVAAGRGGIRKLKAQADAKKPSGYTIFFIGDPAGADVTVTAPPVNLQQEAS